MDIKLTKRLSEIPPNYAFVFPFGKRPALLIHTQKGKLVAFIAICTHLDCTVHFNQEKQRIDCPCHAGIFDLEGRNIGGPPPRPLQRLHVVIKNREDIYISNKKA